MSVDVNESAKFPKELLELAGGIRLLLSDIDGCWTDGTIQFDRHGNESVNFFAHDGYGVKELQRAGIEVAAISGRNNPAVAARAKQLGIREIHLGVADKTVIAEKLVLDRGLSRDQVAALGDDLPDLPLFQAAALTFAPPRATETIRNLAVHVTSAFGGNGALREVCDLLLLGQALNPNSGTVPK